MRAGFRAWPDSMQTGFSMNNRSQGEQSRGIDSLASRLLFMQFILIALMVLVWWALDAPGRPLDVALGGIVGLLAQTSMVWLLRRVPRDDARAFLRRLYLAETVKFGIIALLFALLLRLPEFGPLPGITGFGMTLLPYWIGLAAHKPGNRLFRK
ncbi:MAG: ATP synthase subunit I [Gammaproteobacteria bacterium]|nr:ATP synthase subunit I [Gammaproteobacteria bacterium]